MATSEPVTINSSTSERTTLRRRIGRNSIWLLLARFAGQGLMVAFSLLVARQLGEVVLGQYAFISTVLLIGNMATNLGTDTIVIRHVAAADPQAADIPTADTLTSDLLTTALLIQLALSGLVIAAVWGFAGLLPNQTAATLPAFRLISLALFPIAVSSVLSAVLRGRERMGLYLILTLVTTTVLVLGALLTVNRAGGLFGLAVATLAAQSAGVLVAIGLCRGLRPSLVWQLRLPPGELVRRVARTGFVLALLMVVTLMLGRLGILVLSMLEGDAATGWFTAAARLVEGLKLVPTAVLGALFPVMARQAQREGGGPTPDESRSLRLLLAVGVLGSMVVAVVVSLLAGPVITLLYGPAYGSSVAVLRWLVWVLPFSVVGLSLSFWLVASGRERLVLWAMIPTLAISAVLMVGLVQVYGLMGAAAGSVIAEACQMAALLVAIRWAGRT